MLNNNMTNVQCESLSGTSFVSTPAGCPKAQRIKYRARVRLLYRAGCKRQAALCVKGGLPFDACIYCSCAGWSDRCLSILTIVLSTPSSGATRLNVSAWVSGFHQVFDARDSRYRIVLPFARCQSQIITPCWLGAAVASKSTVTTK